MQSSSASRSARKPGTDRRREIADAALRVIAAQGAAHFTALAIAREVGVSDAALFRHFPTKDAIAAAAIDRMEELLFEGFPPEAAEPLARLGAFFRQRVAVIRANPAIARVFASDDVGLVGDGAGAARLEAFRRRSTAFVRGCLEEARRAGGLSPAAGIDEAQVLVLGALLALAHSPGAASRPPELVERVWRTLETFLRRPDGRAAAAERRPPRAPRSRRTDER
ncbi:transcriptional regulator, TetR family [Anaeromyxobacter dehalogenans 2CP-1]|uniref:Transcriptional regulator, TetR family n=1 Tax=Anaeromyxobacter dehalogenans (strain ATCC BAA-258 / DSM 21875 / 2CP-1) TaxID=455488 RepID=B8JB22_ANAD2|nr:TetR/AcrR family transcriptional regulator [Anaeromyxobacter dehalogenans]ACL63833.1 transcriptional regulator, TetR family [Anaeromyxobacter dehalogenans 2CP-1]